MEQGIAFSYPRSPAAGAEPKVSLQPHTERLQTQPCKALQPTSNLACCLQAADNRNAYNYWGQVMQIATRTGFSGALSTVSTFVAEVSAAHFPGCAPVCLTARQEQGPADLATAAPSLSFFFFFISLVQCRTTRCPPPPSPPASSW